MELSGELMVFRVLARTQSIPVRHKVRLFWLLRLEDGLVAGPFAAADHAITVLNGSRPSPILDGLVVPMLSASTVFKVAWESDEGAYGIYAMQQDETRDAAKGGLYVVGVPGGYIERPFRDFEQATHAAVAFEGLYRDITGNEQGDGRINPFES